MERIFRRHGFAKVDRSGHWNGWPIVNGIRSSLLQIAPLLVGANAPFRTIADNVLGPPTTRSYVVKGVLGVVSHLHNGLSWLRWR